MPYTLPEREAIIKRIEMAEIQLNAAIRTLIITAKTEDLALMATEMEAVIAKERL